MKIRQSKKTSIFIIAIICILVLGLLFLTEYRPWESPERALEKFYHYGQNPNDAVAEDMLMDPLILAGEKVVPLVIKEIKNKDMPKRGYAIAFLKNGAFKEALPAFILIVDDEQENILARSDALKTIYLIDQAVAKEYLSKYEDRVDNLGEMARGLNAGDPRFTCNDHRSFWEAFWSVHK